MLQKCHEKVEERCRKDGGKDKGNREKCPGKRCLDMAEYFEVHESNKNQLPLLMRQRSLARYDSRRQGVRELLSRRGGRNRAQKDKRRKDSAVTRSRNSAGNDKHGGSRVNFPFWLN